MKIKEDYQNQEELRLSLKELVNNLSLKYQNTDEVLGNEYVSVSDVIFETYDTKLTQSYFSFLRNVKFFKASKKYQNDFRRNITTREMIF